MANGYRITAIVCVVLSLLVAYGKEEAGNNSLCLIGLAIFFLLMGYTKEQKKK
jgi:hypothetical protein